MCEQIALYIATTIALLFLVIPIGLGWCRLVKWLWEGLL